MTTAKELIDSFDPDERFILATGFVKALIGVVEGWWAGNHRRAVALYDYEKCVQILMEEGMDELESRECMEVNVTAAYVGEGTPAFATVCRPPILTSLDW